MTLSQSHHSARSADSSAKRPKSAQSRLWRVYYGDVWLPLTAASRAAARYKAMREFDMADEFYESMYSLVPIRAETRACPGCHRDEVFECRAPGDALCWECHETMEDSYD